ncbi:MAG TPA: DNA gyrase inhibitor YacG [Rhizomicrobium sp.]
MSEPSRKSTRVMRKCPTCGEPEEEDFRPFCSKRCADIDLGRWLKGSYRIPTQEVDTDASPDIPEADQTAG